MNVNTINLLCFYTELMRHDCYAVRRANGGYEPLAASVSRPILEKHIIDRPIGLYIMRGDKTRIAVLDFDSHDGATPWPEMVAVVLKVIAAAWLLGLRVHCYRSGGGHGVHLWFAWDEPQNARYVRHHLGNLLSSVGLRDGTGGVARGEVEIFPKQDRVETGKYGNLIALPGARASMPLNEDTLEPIDWEVLDIPAITQRFSDPVPEVPEEERESSAFERLDGDEELIRAALKHVPADDYSTWLKVALALKNAFGEDAGALFDEWSASCQAKYEGPEKTARFWHGLKPSGAVSLGSIFYMARKHGWNGPTDGFVREMNSRFGILTFGSTTLIIPKNGDRHPEDDFMGLLKRTFLDRLAPETIVVDAGSDGGTKRVKKAPAWLSHEKACHYHRLDFDPSKSPGHNGRMWNIWTGFGVEPRPGDWSLLQEHIEHNIARGDRNKADWLFNWMALGVQRPADPIGTAIVLIGIPGIGKGVLAHAYGKLWGSHYLSVTHAEHVSGRFTGHFAGRRFVFIDEGTFGGNRALAGNLKTRVTEPWLVLERKGVDAVRMRNRMIFMIASNEASVVPADAGDRRWMVFDVGDDHCEDRPYFAAIGDQLETGGYEAMLYDLLNRNVQIGPDPRRVIRTEALFEQVLLAGGPELRYVHHLLDTGRLPQNIVAGAASTTIKALVMDMRSQHFDAGYINDVRLGKLLHEIIPGVRTAISGTYLATDKSGETFKERSTRYTFPALAQARREFEKYVRTPVSWSEVADWQNDPDDAEGNDRGYPGDITF